jgi:glycosyltransferase involved in cell wall biosynthesis
MIACMYTPTARPAEPAVPTSENRRGLRILFICHSPAIGGAELYLEQIATRMTGQAAVQLVCRPDPVLDAWAGRIAAAGIEVIRLSPTTPGGFRRLLRLVRRASVVHLTLASRVGSYQVAAALACRVGRRPLVCVHQLAREADDFGSLSRRFRALALGAVYGYARRHIAVSAEGRRLLPGRAGLDAARVVQISNGVDLDRFAPAAPAERAQLRRRLLGDDGGVACCTVARLSRQKGLDVLIQAAARLRDAGPEPLPRFFVIGDGELRDELERLVADLGLEGVVRLVGPTPPDEVPGWLAAGDVFVLPSHYEGMSLAVMEAMASGLPVVVTRVSGTAELVPDDDHGRVVAPGDAGALAAAVRELASDAALRLRLGERAAEHVRGFSWDACFTDTAALLREVATTV